MKKQIEGQITWFYNDAMHQASNVTDGRIVENNFDTFSLSRIDEDPPEINIRFFKTGHWLLGMGHDRATSVQSAIGDAIFQITGKRYPRSAVPQPRSDLELRPLSGISEAISTTPRRRVCRRSRMAPVLPFGRRPASGGRGRGRRGREVT